MVFGTWCLWKKQYVSFPFNSTGMHTKKNLTLTWTWTSALKVKRGSEWRAIGVEGLHQINLNDVLCRTLLMNWAGRLGGGAEMAWGTFLGFHTRPDSHHQQVLCQEHVQAGQQLGAAWGRNHGAERATAAPGASPAIGQETVTCHLDQMCFKKRRVKTIETVFRDLKGFKTSNP